MAIAVPDKIKVLWFLPTHGDSRYLGTAEGGRAVNLPYLRQIAQAADSLGYYGVLLPTGRSCEDSWVVAAALASQTEKLRFLVAVRPGLQSPTLAARMTATLDRLSGGRLLINVVTGGDPVENAGDGIHLSHAERYEVTQEFLTVYKALLAGETVDFHGKHLKIDGGKLLFPPLQENGPPLFFGGSSEAANAVAAKQIHKYLTWGEPPEQVRDKIESVRRLAETEGRDVSFGIRLHVIVRETTAEAWDAAERLISRLDDATIAKAQETFARMDSVGQRRMAELHGGRRDKLEISPNLWAGVGLVRGAQGPRWWATPRPWPSGSTNTAASASTPSSCPAIRTSRKPTALANVSCRCCRWTIRCRRPNWPRTWVPSARRWATTIARPPIPARAPCW